MGYEHKIFVVIPALNEAGTVAGVVRSAFEHGAAKVIVVDDLSGDKTAENARLAGAVVLRPLLRLGAWGAVQTGLRYALARDFDILVTMDADGQHQAEFIPELLDPILRGEADVVIGACPQRGSRARKAAWALFRKLTGVGYEDLTSGFRAYGREAANLLASPEATLIDYQDLGVLLLLEHSGLRIHERPVSMVSRPHGHSRIFDNWFAVARYMLASLVLSVSKSRRAGRIKHYETTGT